MSRPDITLIFPSSPFLLNQTMFPPLGIMYLSSFMKKYGLKAQCLDMALGHTADMAESNIIGLSFTTPQREEAFKLAEYFKKQGRTVVAGGPHPTHMEEECLNHGIDRVFKGYGEQSLTEFLLGWEGNFPHDGQPCKGSYITDADVPDFLPFPDREALPIKEYYQEIYGRPSTPLIASRGCPYRCSFCSKVSPHFSIHSAEYALSEIEHLNKHYGFTAFSIYDDTIAVDKNRLHKMAIALQSKDYLFRCFCRADLLNNESVCGDLAMMGVVDVGIGIESGSDHILKLNMKGTKVDVNTRAIKNLQKYGIGAKAFLIVGLPGETKETVEETARWIEEAQPDDIAVSVFQPLPGSSIFKDPNRWGISFSYNGNPMWYRGTPGEYVPTTRTEALSTDDIIYLREWLEGTYKRKELLK